MQVTPTTVVDGKGEPAVRNQWKKKRKEEKREPNTF